MTKYEQIDTIAHIKRVDVLGIDPLSGNIIIEIHAGPQNSDSIKRFGCFSIERGALEQLNLQTADALAKEESHARA